MKSPSYPYNGVRTQATNKTSDLVIILVHHFGGDQSSLKNHVQLFNELGYDCFTFDLASRLPQKISKTKGSHFDKTCFTSYVRSIRKKYISRQGEFGLHYVWTDQIEDVLNLFSDEPKVVFSQSISGLPSLNAIARLKHKNIHGFIGDGGPFFEGVRCIWKLYTHAFPIPLPLRPFFCLLSAFRFGPNVQSHTLDILKQFPSGFPVLSLRAEKDRLVSLTAIDAVFSDHKHINVKAIFFKNSDHLKPLKDEPEKYKETLIQFLQSIMTSHHQG